MLQVFIRNFRGGHHCHQEYAESTTDGRPDKEDHDPKYDSHFTPRILSRRTVAPATIKNTPNATQVFVK